MKIQSGKPEASYQASSKQNDTALAQPQAADDLFSELISDMLSQGSMQQSDEESSDEKISNTQENQEVDASKSQPQSSSFQMNVLLEQFISSKLTNNVYTQQSAMQETSEVLPDNLETQTKLNQTAKGQPPVVTDKQVKNADAKGLPNVSAKLSDAYLFEMNADETVSARLNMWIEPEKNGQNQWSRADKPMQTTPLNASLKNNEALNVKNNSLLVNDRQKSSTEALTMIFNSQKSLVNYQVEDKNKYVDMLVQLGNMVVPQVTQQTHEADQGTVTPPLPAPVMQQSENAKASQPEYELKIELLPASIESLAKETYNAHIKIYPPELGAILAKLKVDKNNAELIILTDNNRVKEIVEANLSQLRENFKESDINLTNIQVNVQTSQQSGSEHKDPNQKAYEASAAKEGAHTLTQPNSTSKPAVERSNSLIDTYA